MSWGVYDTQDGCWMGSDGGPVTFAVQDLARVAAQVACVRLGWPETRCVAREYDGREARVSDQTKFAIRRHGERLWGVYAPCDGPFVRWSWYCTTFECAVQTMDMWVRGMRRPGCDPGQLFQEVVGYVKRAGDKERNMRLSKMFGGLAVAVVVAMTAACSGSPTGPTGAASASAAGGAGVPHVSAVTNYPAAPGNLPSVSPALSCSSAVPLVRVESNSYGHLDFDWGPNATARTVTITLRDREAGPTVPTLRRTVDAGPRPHYEWKGLQEGVYEGTLVYDYAGCQSSEPFAFEIGYRPSEARALSGPACENVPGQQVCDDKGQAHPVL